MAVNLTFQIPSHISVANIVTFHSADKYSDFIDANRMENASNRLKTMKKLVC